MIKFSFKLKKELIFFFIIIPIWEIASHIKLIDSFLFSSPSKLICAGYKMFIMGELQEHILVTLKRFFWGFFLGGILGLIIGSFCGMSKRLSSFIESILYFTYPIPKFAFFPLLILIFGTGNISKIIFIGLGAFFPIAINTISGIKNINTNFIEVARHYGAKGWKLYKRVILPASLPSIFAGLRISAGITITYVLVIEFLTATNGLGAMIWLSLQTLRIDKLFLGALVAALLNIIFTSFLGRIENFLIPWSKAEKNLIRV